MPPAHRVGDKALNPADAHGCPACPHPVQGPGTSGSPDVFVNNMPQMRVGDPGMHAACCGPNSWVVAQGSSSVFVNNIPPSRIGDATSHCGGSGKVIQGSPNVIIGDYTCAPPPPPPPAPPLIPKLVEAFPRDQKFFVNLPDDEGRRHGRKVTVEARVDPPQGGVTVFFELLDVVGNATEFDEAEQAPKLYAKQATTDGSGLARTQMDLSQVAGDQMQVRATDAEGNVADTGLQAVWRKLKFDVTRMEKPSGDQPWGSGLGLRSKTTYSLENDIDRTTRGLAKVFIELEDTGVRHQGEFVKVLRLDEVEEWCLRNCPPGPPASDDAPVSHFVVVNQIVANGQVWGLAGAKYERRIKLKHAGGGNYEAYLAEVPFVKKDGRVNLLNHKSTINLPYHTSGGWTPTMIVNGELGERKITVPLADMPDTLKADGFPDELHLDRIAYYLAIDIEGYCVDQGKYVVVEEQTGADTLLHEVGHALGLCGEPIDTSQGNHCTLTSCVMYASDSVSTSIEFHGGATPPKGTCAWWLRRLNMSKDHLYERWWQKGGWSEILTEADADGCPCGNGLFLE